jgi:hypothetical protein
LDTYIYFSVIRIMQHDYREKFAEHGSGFPFNLPIILFNKFTNNS